MIEAGAPSTWVQQCPKRCAPPPGELMVASPTATRNAEGTQSEGRVGGGRPSTPVQRGQQYKHYKGRSSAGPRPKTLLTSQLWARKG